MENKKATPLGNCFSTAKNQVSQCDDQTLESITETLIIHFDQEMLEQLLSGGSKSPLHVRKHRKASVAKVPLAPSENQVSVETIKVPCEPNTASCEARQALREPITVPSGTKLAPCQCTNVACETIKVSCEPKTASVKAIWITKSTVPSLDPASCETKIVLDHKTPSSPQLRCPARLKPKHVVLTARLLQPRLLQQH